MKIIFSLTYSYWFCNWKTHIRRVEINKKFTLTSLSNEQVISKLHELAAEQKKIKKSEAPSTRIASDIKEELLANDDEKALLANDDEKELLVSESEKELFASESEKELFASESEELTEQNIENIKENGKEENKDFSSSSTSSVITLNFRNIDLTDFLQCGVYGIENIITKEIYVGQTLNFIVRNGWHFLELRAKSKTAILLQNAWNTYSSKNFNFIILETGKHMQLEENRCHFENRYILEFTRQGRKVYNTIFMSTINDIIAIMNHTVKLDPNGELVKSTEGLALEFKEIPLQMQNLSMHFLFEPGVYSFKNTQNNNNKQYIGEAMRLITWICSNILTLNAGSFDDQKEFQKDWTNLKIENFQISILEYGSEFPLKKTRLAYEKKYKEHFSPNIYNKFIDVKELIQAKVFKRRDWNWVSVYRKIDNDYIAYDSINIAKKDTNIASETLRVYLDNPKNDEWLYGRSYGRYFTSGRIRLIVVELERVYLNVTLASFDKELKSVSTIKRILLKGGKARYFDGLDKEERDSIPNLEKQIQKALRPTIPLPLNLNDSLEKEIFNEQSKTYSGSTEESPLSSFSQKEKDQAYEKWNVLVKKHLNL